MAYFREIVRVKLGEVKVTGVVDNISVDQGSNQINLAY